MKDFAASRMRKETFQVGVICIGLAICIFCWGAIAGGSIQKSKDAPMIQAGVNRQVQLRQIIQADNAARSDLVRQEIRLIKQLREAQHNR